ncbi:hypothetical protein Golomagni_06399 [Golovinomyces magnicellulatus]|nr:hypothetical protein Golomagni_06399 [Golovinomyces magnicellulatus]
MVFTLLLFDATAVANNSLVNGSTIDSKKTIPDAVLLLADNAMPPIGIKYHDVHIQYLWSLTMPSNEPRGTKIKVDNVHYDLTEEDLDELFKRIGTVVRLQLRYDRQDRSEGVAYVTYEKKEDAEEAIRQFDGANANGQPIRLTMLGSRNAFDNAFMPGRPLAERVSGRRYDEDEAARRGIDRYIPGERPRSRSPGPRRRNGGGNGNRGDGRRPGARRDAAKRDENKDGARGNPRPKKTQEELDAEMDDYFTGDTNTGNGDAAAPAAPAVADAPAAAPAAASGEAAAPQGDDVDMIE